jgi:tetratricopeptide (TPR) repeat protein
MGLFDFLKGKENTGYLPSTEKPLSDKGRFEEAVLEAIPRYHSKPGLKAEFNAMGPEGNTPMLWADAHPDIYKSWLPVKSCADRRSIIYKLLDEYFWERLALWQKIERCNDDRYPERALKVVAEMKTRADEKDPNFWNALAKTHFILTNYEEAEKLCKKAMKLDSSNLRTKRILADVLHTVSRHKEAHLLYNEILSAKIPKDKPMALGVHELLGFAGDIVNSPMYAFSWLQSDEKVKEDTWEWATYEFFYSPHFRSQHAYLLVQKGEHLKALAKLASLADEMPWYKEAFLNFVSIMDQLKLNTPPLLARKQQYETVIRENNWTTEGMHHLHC